jgi:hypothetical protein
VAKNFPSAVNLQEPEPVSVFPANSRYELGAWIWDSPYTFDPESRFKYLKEHNFNTVYFDITPYLDIVDSNNIDQNQVATFNEKMHTILLSAQQHGIKVDALAGGKNWGESDYRYLSNLIIDYVSEFNSTHEAKFSGVQFDIEPNTLPDFQQNQARHLTNYLDTVDSIVTRVRGLSQTIPRLGLAIPYWYDGQNGLSDVTWRNESKPVVRHIFNRLSLLDESYIALMDYTNRAAGENGAINNAKEEITFTEKFAPKVDVIVAPMQHSMEKVKVN